MRKKMIKAYALIVCTIIIMLFLTVVEFSEEIDIINGVDIMYCIAMGILSSFMIKVITILSKIYNVMRYKRVRP